MLEAIKKAIANRPSWDELFFTQAMTASLRSIDTSSQVGAVITTHDNVLVSQGYNGPVRGTNIHDEAIQTELVTRPNKYRYFEHAERNAIFNALRVGANVSGGTLYVNGLPCTDCARAISQSGIAKVKVLNSTDRMWKDNPNFKDGIKASERILKDAGVALEYCDVKLVHPHTVRLNGQEHTIE